ncbi:type IIL restriction-modification enzyme MmeI [Limnohabitans sp.]|uniref:type IIL restriction-modification enzyme MmeI n=1 Tax=Limnohabitans sp. TaxID=1907725 RepID=UPI00286F05AA|nr:type IIL restriction-modification enzyme MmeI [Limnohabitans sp.]
MGLNWNEIKSRALLFSKTWADAFIKGTNKHRTSIEQAAQCVLDARAQFAGASLADLYDPLTMPPALLKAHQKLDAAYQPSGGKNSYVSDAERVAFLFELYQRITSLLPATASEKTRKYKATEI